MKCFALFIVVVLGIYSLKCLAVKVSHDDTKADDFAVSVSKSPKNVDGQEESDKRMNEFAEECINETRKGLLFMEQRMDNFGKTLTNITETRANFGNTLTNITETQTTIKETHANFGKTLKNNTEIQANFRKTLANITETQANFGKTLANITETLANFVKTLEYIMEKQSIFEKTLTNMEGILIHLTGTLNSTEDSNKEEIATTTPSTPETNEKVQMTFDPVHKGKNVVLSSDLKTATRTNPGEDGGVYGGVVSLSPLVEDSIFEIIIEETIDRWRDWGMAIGVLEEEKKKEEIKGAGAISNLKGSWNICSWRDSMSGKSNTIKDGNKINTDGYPLDTRYLPVGTHLGVSRHHNGDLHFYLNGVDKGKAFSGLPKEVYAFVEVINYVTKITVAN